MKEQTKLNSAGADAGGDSGLTTGRPTISGNSGSEIPKQLLRAFESADISAAEFLRLPSPRARCRLSGLSRTTLNEAIDRGDVRSVTIRKPGSTRGIKLIVKASLIAWLHRLDAEQNSDKPSDSARAADLPGAAQ